MAEVCTFEPGGYRYIRGPFQYSAGVAAEPGFALERVRLTEPVPVAPGFERIAAHLEAAGRPFYTLFDLHPFCADEIERRGAAIHGLTWHDARPPLVGLDYEMDVRAVPSEITMTTGNHR